MIGKALLIFILEDSFVLGICESPNEISFIVEAVFNGKSPFAYAS